MKNSIRNIIALLVCVICLCSKAAESKNWNDDYIISSTPRLWTDSKGMTVEARWRHINEEGTFIWLKFTNTKKTGRVKVSSLSKKDQKYVRDFIAEAKQFGFIWCKGSYLSKTQLEDLKYIERAKQYIKEKSISGYKDIEVFQALETGALCYYGTFSNGRMQYEDGTRLIYWDEGRKGVLANRDILKKKRMYWAGTMKYTTVRETINTVACYTDDLNWAVYLVRLRMGLHRQDDPKFVSTPKQSETLPKAQTKESDQPIQTGSGFFITKDGFFITNNHVVEGGKSYKVLTVKGLKQAELVQVDPQTDLALMRVIGSFEPIKFSTQRKEKLGATVATIGFPLPGLQGFSPKVTQGVISGENGFKGDVRRYQIDASIQPGNSGGPLFNNSGELVGVVVSSLNGGQLVNYAVKKSYLLAFLDSISRVSEGITLGNTKEENRQFEEVVDDVRSSCALVLTYE